MAALSPGGAAVGEIETASANALSDNVRATVPERSQPGDERTVFAVGSALSGDERCVLAPASTTLKDLRSDRSSSSTTGRDEDGDESDCELDVVGLLGESVAMLLSAGAAGSSVSPASAVPPDSNALNPNGITEKENCLENVGEEEKQQYNDDGSDETAPAPAPGIRVRIIAQRGNRVGLRKGTATQCQQQHDQATRHREPTEPQELPSHVSSPSAPIEDEATASSEIHSMAGGDSLAGVEPDARNTRGPLQVLQRRSQRAEEECAHLQAALANATRQHAEAVSAAKSARAAATNAEAGRQKMYGLSRRLRETEREKTELAERLHTVQRQLTIIRQRSRLDQEAYSSASVVTAAELLRSTEEIEMLRGLCSRQQTAIERLVKENEVLTKQVGTFKGQQNHFASSSWSKDYQLVNADHVSPLGRTRRGQQQLKTEDGNDGQDDAEEGEPPSPDPGANLKSTESAFASGQSESNSTQKQTKKKRKKKRPKKKKVSQKGQAKTLVVAATVAPATATSATLRTEPRALQGGDYDGQHALALAESELARGYAQLHQQQLLHDQAVATTHRQLAEARRETGAARDALDKQRLAWVRQLIVQHDLLCSELDTDYGGSYYSLFKQALPLWSNHPSL